MGRKDTTQWHREQTVLVLQGGGMLGAYQAGVYQGVHEAGIEPDPAAREMVDYGCETTMHPLRLAVPRLDG